MNGEAEPAGEIARFPEVLKKLIEAELAAGNSIAEIGHSFPAPPVGAYVKLARPVSTRSRSSGGGVNFRDFNSSIYSGEFTDAQRFFFVLEPPGPPPLEPDMDAIRAAVNQSCSCGKDRGPAAPPKVSAEPGLPAPVCSAFRRFQDSMTLDYEKWREGIGYDLDALRRADPDERVRIEDLLLTQGIQGWRDVEALAILGTPRSRKALGTALECGNHEVRAAILRHAPELLSRSTQVRSLVLALENAEFYGGLSEALEQTASFHPPPVEEALIRGVLRRPGEIAVHFAAMLMRLHGQAKTPFDWEQRPFFLTFHTEDPKERQAAFRQLCTRTGIAPEPYLEEKTGS